MVATERIGDAKVIATMLNKSDFTRRLSETIIWCSGRVDINNPQWCLRSPELRPDAANTEEFPTFRNSAEAINSVVEQRSRLLNSQSLPPFSGMNGGRLLLCFFDRTNFNGATEGVTKKFFDGEDNPPWDTWVDLIGDALVAGSLTNFAQM